MHELGVARDLVRRACEEVRLAHAERVTALDVEVGPDGGCEPLALQLSLQAAGERTPVEGAELSVRRAPKGGVVLTRLTLDYGREGDA